MVALTITMYVLCLNLKNDENLRHKEYFAPPFVLLQSANQCRADLISQSGVQRPIKRWKRGVCSKTHSDSLTMFRRGNLVTFWRPLVVALIFLLALVLWLGSSDTQVLIHKLKYKIRGELPPWILGFLCKIWWKWDLPGVKMRRLCRPGWSSLGNRGFASRGSADLHLLGVVPIFTWFCLFSIVRMFFVWRWPHFCRFYSYHFSESWILGLSARLTLLSVDIDVVSADRVNLCQKQTWTWPLKFCHVPSRSPRNTSMERTWCSSQRWELLLLSKQLAYIGGSLLGQLGFWLFSISSWKAGKSFYDNDIVQDTHVDWDRQEESACQVWQVLFVSTITLPLPVLWWSHVRSPCSSATQPPARWCAPYWRWGPHCCDRVQLVFQVVLEQVYWKDLKQSEDCVNGEACCDGKALTRKQKSEQVRQDKEKVSNSDKWLYLLHFLIWDARLCFTWGWHMRPILEAPEHSQLLSPTLYWRWDTW